MCKRQKKIVPGLIRPGSILSDGYRSLISDTHPCAFCARIHGVQGEAPYSHYPFLRTTWPSRLFSYSECWLEVKSCCLVDTQTDQKADQLEHKQTLLSRHAFQTHDFLVAAILLQLWRVITPIPPGYYSSRCWNGLGICGRQPYRHARHIWATSNYSNAILNYSDKTRKQLAIIGREETGVTRSDFPAIEIYYYSITGKAIMKLLRSHLMEDAKLEDSIGGQGAEDQSKWRMHINMRACIQAPHQTSYVRWGADDLLETMMHMNVRACTQIQNKTFYMRAQEQRDLV